jgi:hypothetical protein
MICSAFSRSGRTSEGEEMKMRIGRCCGTRITTGAQGANHFGSRKYPLLASSGDRPWHSLARADGVMPQSSLYGEIALRRRGAGLENRGHPRKSRPCFGIRWSAVHARRAACAADACLQQSTWTPRR